jgi:hypothetical protein
VRFFRPVVWLADVLTRHKAGLHRPLRYREGSGIGLYEADPGLDWHIPGAGGATYRMENRCRSTVNIHFLVWPK